MIMTRAASTHSSLALSRYTLRKLLPVKVLLSLCREVSEQVSEIEKMLTLENNDLESNNLQHICLPLKRCLCLIHACHGCHELELQMAYKIQALV